MKRFRILLVLTVVALGVSACASAPPPRVVRLSEVGTVTGLMPHQPLIVELDEGDVLPVKLTLEGAFIETVPGDVRVLIRIKRHCYLRADEHGLKASVDGKNFDWKPERPGSFRVGFGSTKEGGPLGEIEIHTPRPPAALLQ